MNSKTMKIVKVLCVFLSLGVALFAMTGNVLISNKGALSLLKFESFYVYIVLAVITLVLALQNKNTMIPGILTLLTYGWTYFLITQMEAIVTDIQMTRGIHLYIYLASAIFIIPCLFLNPKVENQEVPHPDSVDYPYPMGNSNNGTVSNGPTENDILFANFVSGFKEIALDTTVLLVNNVPNKSLDLVFYANNDPNQSRTIHIGIDTIQNVTINNRVRMQTTEKKVEDNSTKSALLSAAVFGGNPIMQMAGNAGLNNLFSSLSNNYEKVDYNSYYEITILYNAMGEVSKIVVTTDTSPELFVHNLPIHKQ